jgi:glycosyltransferase involved in cell wall biosynthesis
MPSKYEPFGIAYVDAGAAGVPSIGTTVGGAEDAIGGCGRLVDPGDPGALAAAILRHLDDDGDVRARVLEHARARFSWEAAARQTTEVYRELMSSR